MEVLVGAPLSVEDDIVEVAIYLRGSCDEMSDAMYTLEQGFQILGFTEMAE